MKPLKDRQTGRWKLLIPPSLSGTGKRQYRSFATKLEAELEARKIRAEGLLPTKDITSADLALLNLIKKNFGNDPAELIRNLDFAQKTIGGIPVEKREITLEAACIAFVERQVREKRNRRTVYSDRQALKYFCGFAGAMTPLVEITEGLIVSYFDQMDPGGRRRTQHARLKKFFNWCSGSRYLVVNPMEKIRPREGWASNREILAIDAFRRILFVVAGLKPIKSGEESSLRYQRLLPFYVLGGMAGLRRREMISSDPRDPVIEWTDIWWKRDLIEIRKDVAKKVGEKDPKRHPKLEPAAKAWLLPIAKESGPVMEISQSTLQRLNDEMLDALNLEVPENGLRNSYASYNLSFRSLGETAKWMGDDEATVARYYITKLEPDAGKAWFDIWPTHTKGTKTILTQLEVAV